MGAELSAVQTALALWSLGSVLYIFFRRPTKCDAGKPHPTWLWCLARGSLIHVCPGYIQKILLTT